MRRLILLFPVLIFVFFSCSKKNRFKVDVSDVEVSVEIKRLDQDLFEIDVDSIHDEIPYLSEKYGRFYELYNHRVIHVGGSNSKAYPDNLKSFLTDYVINNVHKKVQEKYPDLDRLEEELTMAFKHYKYYFPEKIIPAVYTYIGGFNQSIVIDDSTLAIGLDKYLGSDCEFYDRLGWSDYLQKDMTRDMIASDCMRSWAQTEWPFNDSIDNVMSNMLYKGKLLYFVKRMMPEAHDTIITGFSSQELDWCRNNEEQMWTRIVEKKLLFSSDYMTINKLVNPSPYTSEFTRQSPGQATVWLGLKIVDEYMKRGKEQSLEKLMEMDDYRKILRESHYKP